MKSTRVQDLGPKKVMKSDRIIKLSLTLLLIVFAFTMLYPSSYFQLVKPVMAATLTGISIVPTNNIVNTKATYDIFFKTATTGTIKTISMVFPSSFDISAATKLIEKSGIGTGSLSNPSGSTLVYTVSSPVSVAAGTNIWLEVGKVINSETRDIGAKISITTKDTSSNTIDGPTSSPSFVIKAIEGLDISPYLMVRKTLNDNTAGHAHGWDPNGVKTDFTISDGDVQIEEEAGDQTFITLMLRDSHATKSICMVNDIEEANFFMNCNTPPASSAELHYEIHKLPANVITSSLTSSSSSFAPSQENMQSNHSPSLP